jgi:hypothetical protein
MPNMSPLKPGTEMTRNDANFVPMNEQQVYDAFESQVPPELLAEQGMTVPSANGQPPMVAGQLPVINYPKPEHDNSTHTGTIFYDREGNTQLGFRTDKGQFLNANRQPLDMTNIVSFSNASQPQGTMDDISPNNAFKLTDQIDAVDGALYSVNRLKNLIKPENIGLTGDIVQLVDGATEQSKAFLTTMLDFSKQNSIGMNENEATILNQLNGLTLPDATAGDAARIDWVAAQLAYAIAKAADPGGRVTDADYVNQYKNMILGRLTAGVGQANAVFDEVEQALMFKRNQVSSRAGKQYPVPQFDSQPQQPATSSTGVKFLGFE